MPKIATNAAICCASKRKRRVIRSRASRLSSGKTMRSNWWQNFRAPLPTTTNLIRSCRVLRTARSCIARAGACERRNNMTGIRIVAGAALLLASLTVLGATAGPYVEKELRIPYPAAGAHGLEAVLVFPNEPGRYPLALISHGSPRSASERPEMTPWAMLPQAVEFARRGVVVLRRG